MRKLVLALLLSIYASAAFAAASTPLPVSLGGGATGVNFNSVADTTLTVLTPTTRWRLENLFITNCSAIATTAKFGLFSAASGGGTALIASGTAVTVSTGSANTATSLQAVAGIMSYFTFTTVYFRITTVQGTAVTCDVYLQIQPLP